MAERYPRIVAVVLGVTALATAGSAHAGRIAVVVVPRFDPAAFQARGGVGLLVPGSGATVTRRGALASLVRGRVENSLLGGRPHGRPLIHLAKRPGPLTIYVSLPPPGRHHNTTRYPVAIVGGGYHGLLTSSSTRIPGLVSIADVAPTAVALAAGRRPVIRSRAAETPARSLRALDRRLALAHDRRNTATIMLVAIVLVLAGAALVGRAPFAARAAVLAIPAALASGLLLSALDVYATAWLALAIVVSALAAAIRPRLLAPLLVAFFVGYLVLLAAWPVTNALALIGPHPDGGGRFFGVTNEVETLLLGPAVVAGAALGLRFIPALALLVLGAVGPSATGADGGGTIVLAVGLAALAVRLAGLRLTLRRIALICALGGAVLGGLAAVDAALGGSSHVTRAVGAGPGSLLGDLGHRIHLSYLSTVSSWHAALIVVGCLCAFAFLAALRPRPASLEAILLALGVSLLVNDTPVDVAGFGALVCAAVWTCERVRPSVH